jgi:hypothetical protein
MTPFAQHTKLEKWDENGKPYLEEYKVCQAVWHMRTPTDLSAKGSEKLRNKIAIVTGAPSGPCYSNAE